MIHREAGVFQTSYEGDMSLFTLPLAKWANWGVLFVLIVVLPLILNAHKMSIVNTIALSAIGAIGLNLLVGYTGQISIGQGAFMMIGSYTAAILSSRYGWPFWLGIPAGGVITMIAGTLFGIPSLRIKGLYLAIATLAVQLIVPWMILHIKWIGGDLGSIYVDTPELMGFAFDTEYKRYFLILLFFLLAYYGAQNLIRSRVGRAFIAVRERDFAAEIIGVNLFKYKLLSFAVSSFYAGITGALYAYYLRIANYENFELIVSIDYLAMIIIGGLGSVFGAVLGAIFIRLFPVALDLTIPVIAEGMFGVSYQSSANFLANFQLLIFGVLIIGFLVIEPAGLARLWEHVKRYFRLWPFSY